MVVRLYTRAHKTAGNRALMVLFFLATHNTRVETPDTRDDRV